jgi:single-strand DNA-binding protein
MLNKWIGIGRLTADPTLRYTPQGTAICNFALAINRRFKKEETDFINCQAWSKTGELIAEYLTKGSQCAIEGRIQVRNYENQEGKKVYVTEVIVDQVEFLGGKGQKKEDADDWSDIGSEVSDDQDIPF